MGEEICYEPKGRKVKRNDFFPFFFHACYSIYFAFIYLSPYLIPSPAGYFSDRPPRPPPSQITHTLTPNSPELLEESLLIICSLGIQTQTLSPSYLLPASTRFIPTAQIRDIFIHEAFRGFEVRYYLAIVVEGEWDLVVVFPVSGLFFLSFFLGGGRAGRGKGYLLFFVFFLLEKDLKWGVGASKRRLKVCTWRRDGEGRKWEGGVRKKIWEEARPKTENFGTWYLSFSPSTYIPFRLSLTHIIIILPFRIFSPTSQPSKKYGAEHANVSMNPPSLLPQWRCTME